MVPYPNLDVDNFREDLIYVAVQCQREKKSVRLTNTDGC